MRSLLKEPLLHFVLMGAILFAAQGWRAQETTGEENGERGAKQIAVTAEVITRLKDSWSRQYQTVPTAEELRGLVRAHLREEVLYREALTLGLDRNDEIVRRRLAQKMEFLSEDVAGFDRPDDAELEAYYEQNAARYVKPAQVSFRHVYFSTEKRGARLEVDAGEALAALRGGAQDTTVGDGFLHGFEFAGMESAELTALFGEDFAESLAGLPLGVWQGPVLSTYGTHLILIEARGQSKSLPLPDVLSQVTRDFFEERRRAENESFFNRLRDRYEITIDEGAIVRATGGLETVQK